MCVRRRKFVLTLPLICLFIYVAFWSIKILENLRLSSCKWKYNYTYPLSPIKVYNDGTISFKIAAVADMDLLSPSSNGPEYTSWYVKGVLNISEDLMNAAKSSKIPNYAKLLDSKNERTSQISIKFYNERLLRIDTGFGYKHRGSELSELIAFNGKLYTCDDRTGIVFQIIQNVDSDIQVMPQVLLIDGDGLNEPKGFKCEWMSVKDDCLYVGGLGKEWTTGTGKYVNDNPLYVKIIRLDNSIEHVNWKKNYENIRHFLGYNSPGYMVFEAVSYSKIKRRWFFLPRRVSKELYDEMDDRMRGSNLLISTSVHFDDIQSLPIGEHIARRGFSSFKFIPNTNDNIIIALRTEEIDDTHMKSYYVVFSVDGQILVPETELSNSIKYEGIEFV